MATISAYSGWSQKYKPSGSDSYRQMRCYISGSYTVYDTYVSASVNMYMQISGGSMTTQYASNSLRATSQSTSTSSNRFVYGGSTNFAVIGRTYTWNRTTSAYNVSIGCSCVMPSSSAFKGTYSCSTSFDIPQLQTFTVGYDKGSQPTATGTVSPQTKYFSVPLTITSSKFSMGEAYTFAGWNTAIDGSGTPYNSGSTYSANSGTTLYAQWSANNPPTCDNDGLNLPEGRGKAIKNFTPISTTITNVQGHNAEGLEPKQIASVEFTLGNQTIIETENFERTYSITPTDTDLVNSHDIKGKIKITDEQGAYTIYPLTYGESDAITVEEPTWHRVAEFDTLIPDNNGAGFSNISIEAYNYDDSVWEEVGGVWQATGMDNNWSVELNLAEKYIPVAERETANPTPQIRASYDHSEHEEKDYRKAFYGTTRNANYSTGLSNIIFVGGVTTDGNFSSRVWWSQVNNPLYFPDTNYVEVGSNDTQVMGLTKVGDYLGVVKQSKTTDTAIYLLYPTSFDDETTFAIKQGVQGVGALGKYSFNILGDETLFLSPNGVMAIVSNEDEEHKVQNRSFYIDGKLLNETDLANSYSFVFDGKYWLAVNDNCYVLDGNNRNSWGNDKTNLVYECYYLENIPATCFMKYADNLWFSNDEYLCHIKTDGDMYVDSYNGTDEFVPVKCEWSTVLDDDGSLHYYKTMQKKGGVVSLLPETLSATGTKVFVKKDTDEPVEITREFSTHEGIPNELFINKKFKKYKRLQFIIRNEEAEPFGVNSITKQYIVCNYAKK